MLTLSLFRHAKSSWDNATLDDFDRPLAERGLLAAPVMGAHMAAIGVRPDVILCSASVRTRATLDLVLPFLKAAKPAIVYEEALYLASASDLLTRVRHAPARATSVMMIGHNPGFHDFAMALTGVGDPSAMAALAVKYPTAALAVITFETPTWAKIAPRTGHLVQFATPSALEKGLPTT